MGQDELHSNGLLGHLKSNELESMVWSKPICDVAIEYLVCDQTVRRECLRRGIPLPPMGWSQSELMKTMTEPDRIYIAKRQAWSEIEKHELALLLQQHTAVSIGNMYGISSSAVKKKANKMNIQTMPRGFWGHNQYSK